MPQVATNKIVVRLLSIREVAEHFGISQATVYRMISCNEFPKPIRIGRRAVRWSALHLNRFIQRGCRMEGAEDVQD